jgi:hypothetical protein
MAIRNRSGAGSGLSPKAASSTARDAAGSRAEWKRSGRSS